MAAAEAAVKAKPEAEHVEDEVVAELPSPSAPVASSAISAATDDAAVRPPARPAPAPSRPTEDRHGAGSWTLIISGSALVAAGAFVPFVKVADQTRSIAGLSVWGAAAPLAGAVGALIAWRVAMKATRRPIARGALLGFGLYQVLLFLSYALMATSDYDIWLGSTPSLAAGSFVGLAGALLLTWAGFSLPADTGGASTRTSVEQPVYVGIGLALLGAVVLVLSTFALPAIATLNLAFFGTSSAPWIPLAVESLTLLKLAAPLAIPPIGVAVAVSVSGYAILRQPARRAVAVGVLSAIAIEAILDQLTLIGAGESTEGLSAGAGTFVGLAATGLILAGAVIVLRSLMRPDSGVSRTGLTS
jgi:hypothetical protein